ncbi:MAG: cadherin-like domain-containing protein [Pseudomonadota bacterium]
MATKHAGNGRGAASSDAFFGLDEAARAARPKGDEDVSLTSPIDDQGEDDVTLGNLHLGSAGGKGGNVGATAGEATRDSVLPSEDTSLAEPGSARRLFAAAGPENTDAAHGDAANLAQEQASSLSEADAVKGDVAASVTRANATLRTSLDPSGQATNPDDAGLEAAPSPETAFANGMTLDPALLAVDDRFSGREDEPISGNLLANDLAGDGAVLSLAPGEYDTAQGGRIIVDANGSFTYVPAADFSGADSFSYAITDGNGLISQATAYFDIAAVNDTPAAPEAPSKDGETQAAPEKSEVEQPAADTPAEAAKPAEAAPAAEEKKPEEKK